MVCNNFMVILVERRALLEFLTVSDAQGVRNLFLTRRFIPRFIPVKNAMRRKHHNPAYCTSGCLMKIINGLPSVQLEPWVIITLLIMKCNICHNKYLLPPNYCHNNLCDLCYDLLWNNQVTFVTTGMRLNHRKIQLVHKKSADQD